jgi:peptidoglycan/LPS O-acetylase OafA/YrhL
MEKFGKAIVAFLYAAAFVAIPQLSGDGHLDPSEGVTLAIAVVTAAGVYLVPLAPSAKWTKTAVGVLLAALNVAAVVILDHRIDAEEWLMILTSVAGALGITVAPAASPKTGTAVGWGADR